MKLIFKYFPSCWLLGRLRHSSWNHWNAWPIVDWILQRRRKLELSSRIGHVVAEASISMEHSLSKDVKTSNKFASWHSNFFLTVLLQRSSNSLHLVAKALWNVQEIVSCTKAQQQKTSWIIAKTQRRNGSRTHSTWSTELLVTGRVFYKPSSARRISTAFSTARFNCFLISQSLHSSACTTHRANKWRKHLNPRGR